MTAKISNKTILGIDVGFTGALSFYDGDELLIYDMPIRKHGKVKKLDALKIKAIIEIQKPDHVYIEQVNAFGMGVSSAFNFGHGVGVLEGIIGTMMIPYTMITPQAWKKAMDCPTDKDSSRSRASQLLPEFAHNWDRKKDHGRAEAALIALYGFNH